MSETHTHCQCDYCSGEDCGRSDPDAYEAEQEDIQKQHDDVIRKAERERVLDELSGMMFVDTSMRFLRDTYRLHIEWYEAIQSLRKGAP